MKHAARSVIAVAAVALLAGCVDDTPSSPRGSGPPGSRDNPLIAQTNQPTKAQVREPGAARTSTAAAKPGYQKLVQRQSSRPRTRFTPCNLVTRAQARAIVGEPMQQLLEAPQGPTCIYRPQKGTDLVTLAVQEKMDFIKLKGRLRQPTRVKISSRTGICGQYGQPMLYVQLSRERVLTVAAPCAVAKQFASRAVERLDG